MTYNHYNRVEKSGLTHLTYGLFLLGIFTGFITSLIALALAYFDRNHTNSITDRHYDYLIGTFWSACVWAIILFAVLFVFGILTLGLGFMAMGFAFLCFSIWYGYRLLKGWVNFTNGQMPPIVA